MMSRLRLFFVLSLALAISAQAQEGVTPPNPIETPDLSATTVPTVDENGNQMPLPVAEGSTNTVPVRGNENTIMSAPRRFQFLLALTMRGVYDDNINLSPRNGASDFYFAIEPIIAAGFGDLLGSEGNYLRLDYIPSFFFSADHSSLDAVQHIARLSGQYRFSRLTISATEDIEILDGANLPSTTPGGSLDTRVNLDVNGQRRENVFRTQVKASYDLTGKTFLSGGIDASVNDYSGTLISSEYVSGNLFLNYNYSPKVVLGLGGTAGYNWVGGQNPNQRFEQINVRGSYQATGKLSLNASVGVEFRQFENGSASEHVSPVYSLGASYQPFDGTTFTLTGSRQTQNSAVLNDQDYIETDITFGVRQRLLQRIFLGLSVGYENTSYYGTSTGVNASRSDNYYFVEPTIDVTITRWLTAGIYYYHRRDKSSFETYSFNDNQVGIRTSLQF